MELRTINVTNEEVIEEKRTALEIIFQVGITILLTGVLCYLASEIWFIASAIANERILPGIMYLISEAACLSAVILIMIWINVKKSKKEKALSQAILGFLFYLFTYSFSLIFYPGLSSGNMDYGSLISSLFNQYSLNFTGLIANMAIALGMFIFLLITNKKPETKNIRKMLLAFSLPIIGLVNLAMDNKFRYSIFEYSFTPSFGTFKDASSLFLPRFIELVIFVVIFLVIIANTIISNKRFEKLCYSGIIILIVVSYLIFSARNGIVFDFNIIHPIYTPISIGKIMMYIGAPIALVTPIINLVKIATEPIQITTLETITTSPAPVVTTKPKRSKTKQKDPIEKEEVKVEEKVEVVEEVIEEDTFVETERYDELFETGLFHIRNGEFDRAIEYWERCVKAKPDFLPGWNNLGLAYKDIEQIDKAIACWSKALEINPNYAEASHNLEVALLLKRKRR